MKQPAKRLINRADNICQDAEVVKTLEIWPLLLDACIEDPQLRESFPDVAFNAKMVDLLLAHGASPYFRAPTAPHTVLETVARANSTRALRILLDKTRLGNVIKIKEQNLMLAIAANNDQTIERTGKDLSRDPKIIEFWPKYYGR